MAIKDFNGHRTRIPRWAKFIKAARVAGAIDSLDYRGFKIVNSDKPRVGAYGCFEGPFFVFTPKGEPTAPILESLDDARHFIEEFDD